MPTSRQFLEWLRVKRQQEADDFYSRYGQHIGHLDLVPSPLAVKPEMLEEPTPQSQISLEPEAQPTGGTPTITAPAKIKTPEEMKREEIPAIGVYKPSLLERGREIIEEAPEATRKFITQTVPGFVKPDIDFIINTVIPQMEASPAGQFLRRMERGARELVAPLPKDREFREAPIKGKIEAVLRAVSPARGELREPPSVVESIYKAYPNMPPEAAATIATFYQIGTDPLFADVLKVPAEGVLKIADFVKTKGITITEENIPKIKDLLSRVQRTVAQPMAEAGTSLEAGMVSFWGEKGKIIKEDTLNGMIKSLGGLKIPGDLRGGFKALVGGEKTIISKKGLGPDVMIDELINQGLFPQGATQRDLMDALFQGKGKYPARWFRGEFTNAEFRLMDEGLSLEQIYQQTKYKPPPKPVAIEIKEGKPHFKSTEEAVAYGKTITGKADEITKLEQEAQKITGQLRELEKLPEPPAQQYADLAVKKQFINEAIQEAKTPELPPAKPPAPPTAPPPAGEVPRPKPTLEESMARMKKVAAEARKMRPAIKAEYTKGLAEKFGKIQSIYENETGMDAYNKALAALKGGMRRVPQLSEELNALDDLDNLLTAVQRSNRITLPEKISAQKALVDLMSGKLPQPKQLSLLEDIFGTDFIRPMMNRINIVSDVVISAANVLRTLQSGIMDLSPVLIQNVIYTFRRPIRTIKNIPQAIMDMFSPVRFGKWLESVYNSPKYLRARQAGLEITDPAKIARGIIGREEITYGLDIVERIPVLGQVAKATSRFYHGFINRMRWDVFNSAADAMRVSVGESPKALRDLADVVNIATSRARLTDSQLVNKIAALTFYSPRNWMAKLQMVNPYYYYRLHPYSRKMLMTDLATYVAGAGSLTALIGLYLSNTGRGGVELDPRSTDFGKIRVGSTRWHLWGGFQPLVRTFFQVASGEKKVETGEIKKLGTKEYRFSRADVLLNYVTNKFSPAVSIIYNWMEGEQKFKEEEGVLAFLKERVAPMYVADIIDGAKEMGWWSIPLIGGPSFIGVSTQTYGADKLRQAIARQRSESMRRNEIAEDLYRQMAVLPLTNQLQIKEQLYAKYPALYDRIQVIEQEKARGLTEIDRLYLQLGVQNRVRAKYLLEELRSLDTRDKKINRIRELMAKGILTSEVYSQMLQMGIGQEREKEVK